MRKIVASLTTLSVVGAGIGYILTNSTVFSICAPDAYSCRELYNSIGDPLFYGMVALSSVFVLLLAFPSAFNAWKNFALWFLPPAIDLFATYKGPGGGFMDPLPGTITVYRWVGGFYVIISVLIIAVSVLRKKFGKPQTPKKVSTKRNKIIFWSLWAVYVVIIIGAHFFD